MDKQWFDCEENLGQRMTVENDGDGAAIIAVISPIKNGWRELPVCLTGEELERFKSAVAAL